MIEVRLHTPICERGVGVTALAQRAGVHTSQLWIVLRQPDRVHLRTLEGVCRALGVRPGEMLVQTQRTDLGQESAGARSGGGWRQSYQ